MAKLSKRMKAVREIVDRNKLYSAAEGFDTLKKFPPVKFVESVDVAIQLGIDPTKSDQNVRGATVLPHGTGKDVRVVVFAQGENAESAKTAGADRVGMQDLVDEIKKGFMDFDVVIATPDAMRIVGQVAKVLGPRGLMPNPKVGTVTTDVTTAVKNAKMGQVRYRNDKTGVVQASIGKVNFSSADLLDNLNALVDAINKQKPSAAKGTYIKKICISTTMGGGVTIDKNTLSGEQTAAAE